MPIQTIYPRAKQLVKSFEKIIAKMPDEPGRENRKAVQIWRLPTYEQLEALMFKMNAQKHKYKKKQ